MKNYNNGKNKAYSIRNTTRYKKTIIDCYKKGFSLIKKYGGNKKVVIFTESVATLKQLYELLSRKYCTSHTMAQQTQIPLKNSEKNGEILISTNNGTKGFHLAEASFVIHYDLLYNILKIE